MDAEQTGPVGRWLGVARKHWLNSAIPRITSAALKSELWDPLEAECFSTQSLAVLESLQLLEKLLWPTFTEDATNQHVLLITTFVNVKHRARLQDWDLFAERIEDFSHLFRRVLSLTLDQSLSTALRLGLITFIHGAFQSLEKEFVRKECAPLVSISIWHNLHSADGRERLLDSRPGLRKAWRAAQKRFEAAEEPLQKRIQFDRAWLYSAILHFFGTLYSKEPIENIQITYCAKFLELLSDLLSQLPTRRYTLALLKDLNLMPVILSSPLFSDDKAVVLHDLSQILQHFLEFKPEESHEQASTSVNPTQDKYKAFDKLRRTAMKLFPEKLKVLALSNFSSATTRGDLRSHFSSLTEEELEQVCDDLGVRRHYPEITRIETTRELLLESLFSLYAQTNNALDVHRSKILPTEETLYDAVLLRNEIYDGSRPVALPKLNLQYLDLNDFFWRSFVLHRSEALYEIRKDVESAIRRMKPRYGQERNMPIFDGFSKMAIPITKPAIVEVGQPKFGKEGPSFVRAEIAFDVRRLNQGLRNEWESLRPNDVIFLVAVKTKQPPSRSLINGDGSDRPDAPWELAHVRSAEVVQVLDDNGRPLRDARSNLVNGYTSRSQKYRLMVNVDPAAYKFDLERVAQGKSDVYSSINVLVRRNRRENNFKPILETMQSLLDLHTTLPVWLQDVFLGYGNPRHASYPQTAFTPDRLIDFLDTFINKEHLIESFPTQKVSGLDSDLLPTHPPFVLKLSKRPSSELPVNPRKRRRDQLENEPQTLPVVRVTTHPIINTGPYPTDKPNVNKIRFTQKQVEALVSGVHPGLTVIVGPPGTGKTDVAAQLIHLLTSNYPQERILLVAHSNQALNQLFQKITALAIDPRHLLRLGHGEEELETEESYSKFGRVESFLENRQHYLAEVDRLAKSIGAEGAHGSTCETAEYFSQVYIEPAWLKFWSSVENDASTPESIRKSFPFHKYFSNAPVPALFPANATSEEMVDIARGCQHHIDKIFSELAVVRPFEILRHSRDQQNHLLVKEARVIAMTSTHAGMRRSEIANLGFHYDTLIMEEAAQITEIESFIPCAMQTPDPNTAELPLKRIVLVGDHLQNSPVVQNLALRHFANYEQSMFLRLVRLGVPTVELDRQGRCRPSIADLFRWRYKALGDLPHIHDEFEYSRANAGLKYEYQFIDVPDYQGQGEREPSPYFFQNLGEAEYVVALYQYMRLLGYPAKSISILATYAGQKALLKDVLDHRCRGNKLFGLPRIVTTVDKYQGEQNDYVIVSMTRSRHIGYLRDVRRLTVLLSRARLGLYIFGRRELFETCPEMKPAMDLLVQRTTNLSLTMGELHPTTRMLDEMVDATEMAGVEHLGQYVYEMTQAKVKALGGQISMTEAEAAREGYIDDELGDGEPEDAVPERGDDDPLHENV